MPTTAGVLRLKRTTIRSPAIFCTCCMVKPSELHERALDITFILYAEHEFNASTFTSRVITGTGTDFFSAITGAIGALKGKKHGGANEGAMEVIERYKALQKPAATAPDAQKQGHHLGVWPPGLHHFRSARQNIERTVVQAVQGFWRRNPVRYRRNHRRRHVG